MNLNTFSTRENQDKPNERPVFGDNYVGNEYMNISEEEVWKKFKSGDETAFVHIYEEYFSTLFNYAHRFTNDREIVKDHIQDMFIDLRKSHKRLSDTTSIKFYLFSSIRRRILRAESKKIFFMNTDDYQNYDFEITLSPEQKLINSQMDEKIREVLIRNISKLSSRQKEAIMHYYFEGFSYEQISKLMGFSKVKYARILVYRAVKKLKESIRMSELLIFILASFLS